MATTEQQSLIRSRSDSRSSNSQGKASPFGGIKHARFLSPDVPYHALIRVVQGRFLLRPDDQGRMRRLVGGVMGRAREVYPAVRIFADAWLSNHAHLLVQGPPDQLSAFLGFVSREISRRWGAVLGWEGNMFVTYIATALPTPESQQRAFTYVLAQSAKEHLVQSPLHWPGAHSARDLVAGLERTGVWFDGTGYGRALHRWLARPGAAKRPSRRSYQRAVTMAFDKLPALAHLDDAYYRSHVREVVEEIEREAAAERRATGRRLVGRRAILRTPREKRSSLPRPPWFELRRRMICWADRWASATRAYLEAYWRFQRAHRAASMRFLAGRIP